MGIICYEDCFLIQLSLSLPLARARPLARSLARSRSLSLSLARAPSFSLSLSAADLELLLPVPFQLKLLKQSVLFQTNGRLWTVACNRLKLSCL